MRFKRPHVCSGKPINNEPAIEHKAMGIGLCVEVFGVYSVLHIGCWSSAIVSIIILFTSYRFAVNGKDGFDCEMPDNRRLEA